MILNHLSICRYGTSNGLICLEGGKGVKLEFEQLCCQLAIWGLACSMLAFDQIFGILSLKFDYQIKGFLVHVFGHCTSSKGLLGGVLLCCLLLGLLLVEIGPRLRNTKASRRQRSAGGFLCDWQGKGEPEPVAGSQAGGFASPRG
jgi:hypothetical protein